MARATTFDSKEPLTSADIKALRNADKIFFNYRDGKAFLQAICEDGPKTQENVIPVGMVARLHVKGAKDIHKVFHTIFSAKYHDEWRSALRLLKPGHHLTVNIEVNNLQSPVMREDGYNIESFGLTIAGKNLRLHLLIDVQVYKGMSAISMAQYSF